MPTSAPDLLTVGHGALDCTRLASLLHGAGVDLVVDVRRFPASRTNPDVRREALQEWLPGSGIGYRWEQRLGGRRHSAREAAVLDTWWTVPAFRRTQRTPAALSFKSPSKACWRQRVGSG